MINGKFDEVLVAIYVTYVRNIIISGENHTMIFPSKKVKKVVLPKIMANLPFEFQTTEAQYGQDIYVTIEWI